MKEHPAFRKGLDPGYVFPVPVCRQRALPPLRRITQKAQRILRGIGYSEIENLGRVSQNERDGSAKMIAVSLCDAMDLSDLPWEVAKGPPAPAAVCLRSEQFGVSGYSLAGLMVRLQQIAQSSGFLFCHPDPTILYVRSADGESYVTVAGSVTGRETVTVALSLHRGSRYCFEALRTQISALSIPTQS
jgi:hypothetical protein